MGVVIYGWDFLFGHNIYRYMACKATVTLLYMLQEWEETCNYL